MICEDNIHKKEIDFLIKKNEKDKQRTKEELEKENQKFLEK